MLTLLSKNLVDLMLSLEQCRVLVLNCSLKATRYLFCN